MSHQSICILGRLPGISLAELESLYGDDNVSKLSNHAALIDLPVDQINFSRIGGTIKLAELIKVVDIGSWDNIINLLLTDIEENLAEGSKITLGFSAYDLSISPKKLMATALEIKKSLKQKSISTRVVPNKTIALSSAQVFHNRLYAPNRWEICLIKSGNKIYVARTKNVQNIDEYTNRDQKRPKRDARVGMLSPKLAQTIINLAKPLPHETVIDPFCGTGVVLQEALLMGFPVIGTDIEPRMIDYSDQNINKWLVPAKAIDRPVSLFQADATKVSYQQKISTIASEAFLGRPLTSLPDSSKLQKIIQDVSTILLKFLKNIHSQTSDDFRACIAVPAWRTHNGDFIHLPLLDSLERIGYTRVSFKHASNKELVYFREDQTVARELLIIRRK